MTRYNFSNPKWTKEQDDFLIDQWNKGVQAEQIAQELAATGVRPGANKRTVRQRAFQLRSTKGIMLKPHLPQEAQLQLPIDNPPPAQRKHKHQHWGEEEIATLVKMWDDPTVTTTSLMRQAARYRRGVTYKMIRDVVRFHGAKMDRRKRRKILRGKVQPVAGPTQLMVVEREKPGTFRCAVSAGHVVVWNGEISAGQFVEIMASLHEDKYHG